MYSLDTMYVINMRPMPLRVSARWIVTPQPRVTTAPLPRRKRVSIKSASYASSASVRAAATQETEPGKHISSTSIPAFIPRQDLIQQLWGWARIECEDAGTSNYGLPMKVRPVYRGKEEEQELWGFITSILTRDGAVSTDIRVMFDDKVVTKHQWVGRGADGFPRLEGNTEEVVGDKLVIRKIDDNPIDDQTRSAIRAFCVKLVESLNKYYAFGSCFVDDTT